MVQQVVTPVDLGNEFDIGNIEANKIHVNFDETTITRDTATGVVSVIASGLSLLSTDAGNVLTTGGDGLLFIDNEIIQDAIGAAIAAGAGIEYDDALNAISSAFAGMVGVDTNSISMDYDPVAKEWSADLIVDPAAGNLLTVTATGVAVNTADVVTALSPEINLNNTAGSEAIEMAVAGNVVDSLPLELVESVFGVPQGYYVQL